MKLKKNIPGEHLVLPDYLCRNLLADPVRIDKYDEEFVIDCVITSTEFANNHGSITDGKKATKKTEQTTAAQQTNNQSESRHVNITQPENNK